MKENEIIKQMEVGEAAKLAEVLKEQLEELVLTYIKKTNIPPDISFETSATITRCGWIYGIKTTVKIPV